MSVWLMESVDFEWSVEGWVMQTGIDKSNSENEFITEFDAIFKSLLEPLGNVSF